MSNKEIKIRWISDDSAIDQSITNLQRKLQQMNKSSSNIQGIKESGGQLSQRAEIAQKVFQKTSSELLQKESRELEQRQRKETLAMMEKQRELNKIQKSEGEITNEKKKQIDLLRQEINMRAQQVMDIESTKKRVDDSIRNIQGGPKDQNQPGQPSQPPQNQNQAMEKFKDILKSLGIASVLNGAINFAQHRIERERNVLTSQGETARMAARELREQAEGQGSRGLFFAEERQRAMRMAAQEQGRLGNLDFAKLGAGVAAGAAGGSFLPGIGTAAGAVVGGISAFGGMMAGSDKLYSRVFDQEQYRQMMTKEGMQKYEANRRMLEMQNPLKTMAYDSLQQTINKDVGLERSLGMGNRDLYGEERRGPGLSQNVKDILDTPMRSRRYFQNRGFDTGRGTRFNIPGYEPTGTSPLRPEEGGLQGFPDIFQPDTAFDFTKAGTGAGRERGFLERNMKPYGTQFGFEREDVEGSVQALIGAGATTEGARDMAGQALQFQRNLRLQNAPQVMGQISGAGNETSQTDQMVLRLMSEAVKIGVDTSKMPQEMQRMTEITAELATQGGGFSGMAAENFAAGLTGFSQSEMQGAKGAFEEMQGRAKTAGGFEGQMGMGFLMGAGGQEAFGAEASGKIKGDSKLMNALNQYSAEDLERDPGLLKGLAQQIGISEDALLEGMRKKDEFKQTRTSSQQAASKKLGERIKGMTPDEVSEFYKTEEGAGLYSQAAIEDVASFGTAESGKGASERQAAITARAIRGAGGRQIGGGETEGLQQRLQSNEVSELEQVRSSRATGDELKIQAVNKNLDELVNAAKKHSTAAEMYNQQFDRFVEFAKKSGDALEQMGSQIDKVIEMMAENGVAPSSQPR